MLLESHYVKIVIKHNFDFTECNSFLIDAVKNKDK